MDKPGGRPDVAGRGPERRTAVGGTRLRVLCILRRSVLRGARFSAFTPGFWKAKRHVSKCEVSILMTLFPNSLVLLGQDRRFECKHRSQADCTRMHSGGPPMRTSGSPWLRESLSTHFRRVPHPALLARPRGGRRQLSGLSTPRGQGPSPFTPFSCLMVLKPGVPFSVSSSPLPPPPFPERDLAAGSNLVSAQPSVFKQKPMLL